MSTAIKNINLIAHLEEQKEMLEQKVYARVAEIEHQKLALTAMNSTLEQANLRQEELLVSLRTASAELERQNREDCRQADGNNYVSTLWRGRLIVKTHPTPSRL